VCKHWVTQLALGNVILEALQLRADVVQVRIGIVVELRELFHVGVEAVFARCQLRVQLLVLFILGLRNFVCDLLALPFE
jgi:hypothetical protein